MASTCGQGQQELRRPRTSARQRCGGGRAFRARQEERARLEERRRARRHHARRVARVRGVLRGGYTAGPVAVCPVNTSHAAPKKRGERRPPLPSLFTNVSLHSSVYIRTLLARVHSEAPGSGEAEGRVPSSSADRARKRGDLVCVVEEDDHWQRKKERKPPSSNAVILISDRFGCSHHEQTLGCSYPDSEGAL